MDRISISDEQLLAYLKGNRHALKYVMGLYKAIHLWDDLIDKDCEVGDSEINKVMFSLMCEVPINPFYLEFHYELAPMLRAMVTDWMDSVPLERHMGVNGKAFAYGLRASFSNMVIQCAYLLGGYEWMLRVSTEVRAAIIHCESYENYLSELEREKADRDERN
jgi:hypothetical protein